MDLNDKSVLVTGGTRGIGLAVARAFAARGARVAMVYRGNDDAARQAIDGMPGSGHISIRADIAEPDQVERCVTEAIAELGAIDILVNNAGIGIYHPLESTSFADWQRAWQQTLATNLIAPANLCFHVARHMMSRGGGRIVNISSRGAFRGEPIKPAYGASKAGLNALGQSLAVALAPHRIFVGTVAPGFVNTELAADRLNGPEGDEIRAQSPLNRVAEPEDVAQAVLFLAAPGTEFSTGTIIDVNGASYLRS
ncbi:MAG: SDR family oxidoreductase [Gammaproteobacteria bacterium]